ncbi:MAG: hypothetical protein GY869_05450, partial [Planctomycetes bacterium]|nr:hypothetical protein [Planctomycetota bacterium]
NVISVYYNNILKIFNPTSSNPIWERVFDGDIEGFGLSPDGTQIYVCEHYRPGVDSAYVSAFNIGQDQPIWERSFPGVAEDLTVSEDGNTLVFIQYLGAVDAMWAISSEDGSIIFQGPEFNQNPPAISADGTIIVNGDYNGNIQVYQYDPELETYAELWNYSVPGNCWIMGMDISADGSTIAVGTLIFESDGYNGEMYVFDSHSPQPLWIYENTGDSID